MIPLRQKVTITKNGGLDDWGEPTAGVTLSYPCRISEVMKIVKDNKGAEVVSTASVLMKGYVEVKDGDSLSWEVENGETRTELPIRILYKRDLGGNVLYTKVAM